MTRRLLLLSIAVQCLACHAQRQEFCDKIFACDVNAPGDQCGPSCRGRPMTCFNGSQLGGTDFCAESCDPIQPSDDSGFTCTTSGALLKKCDPNADAGAEGCPAGLECYRTDIPKGEGLCMDLHVCATDNDCTGSPRTVCAATILKKLAPMLSPVDHLQCLQQTCTTTQSMCLASEACLADYYSVGSAPDICVPRCDGKHQCPPNFACVLSTSGAGSPSICVPGVPGERCVTDQDCLIGGCFDTGAGFSECVPTFLCASDLACGALNTSTSTWACDKNVPMGQCVSTTPFHGANCNETADAPNGNCTGGRTCFRYSPYNPAEIYGECRVPCDPGTLTCPAIGGIPHVCLAGGAGGCYPSSFALPCNTDADCLTVFSCQPVSPDERTVITSPSICTKPCMTDDDCRTDPFIKASGFCKVEDGLCRIGGLAGTVCDRDEECREGLCLTDQSGQKLCTL